MIGGQSLVPDAAMAQGAQTNWSGPTLGILGGGASGHSTQTDPGFQWAKRTYGPDRTDRADRAHRAYVVHF